MENRKTYEMMFALNAQMNGGFSGTFTKAQAEFSRLGKEIQNLHRLQGDVASYQKQQGAVEATRSKLENLQKQHDLLQKEIKETNGSTTALEREKTKLEQRIKDTETALERQSQRLQTTGARLKEAGVDTANLSAKDAELASRIRELEAEQEKAARGAQSFGEKSAAAFDAIGQSIITSQVIEGLNEIKDGFMACVETAGNFEEAMSTVEALSGAGAAELAALTEEAKSLGAATKFTALEAADAMGYMAMAGWDAQQMMSGMDGVIQLAAASGEDLAMVSDIVTDNLTAFGLTASDTAHFADVLAAAATNSNTSVGIMGETFKGSASIAGALGYSIEDVAVAVGLMANAGVKGSVAGTALKNTFNGLLEGATLTGAAFGECEFSAVRADGTMKDFAGTIDELRGYFEQMTEAERVNNAMTLAGQRGYNGLLAILNATDEDYASLVNSINNCTGAAKRMADVKLDNMNGQLALMESAWDALRTTIGEEFVPELRNVYEIGTDAFSGMNEFVKANPGVVKGIAAGAAVIGTATAAVTGFTAAAKLAAAATALVPGAGQIMAIAAALAGVVGVTTALADAMDDGIPSVRELTEAARDMQDAMDEAGTTYEQSAAQTMAATEAAGIYINKLEEIEAATGGAVDGNQEYQNILALLLRTMPELSDCISETTDEYGRSAYTLDTDTQSLRENTEELKKNAEARAYQEYMNALYDQYGAVMLEAAENEVKRTQAQTKLKTAEDSHANALKRMNELEQEAAEGSGVLSREYFELQDSLRGYEREMNAAKKEIDTLDVAIEEDAEAVAAAEAKLEDAGEMVAYLTGKTKEQTDAEAEAAEQTKGLQNNIEDITERMAALTEAYDEAYDAALTSIQGQYSLWQKAEKVTATSADSVNKALESQADYWKSYNDNLQTLMENAGDVEGLNEMLASLKAGDADTVNFVAGLAEAAQNDKQALVDMVDNWQEAKREQEEAAAAFAEYVEDFRSQMDGLQEELDKNVEAMNMADEAEANGRATIQGYIDGVNAMLPQVRDVYKAIAQAPFGSFGVAPYSNGVNRGYASGTNNAQPGWAYVGEDGPELMFFNGGEKVLNAAQTSALQTRAESAVSAAPAPSSGGSGPQVHLAFEIKGNATPEVVQDLRGFADEIVDRVLGAIEDAEADAARGEFR